ncbi:MAG TPA: molybdopterin converting factor subunit 1 [Herbaspirillum sp.]|jgi:molybdopterin synthase sulfur carrier subunit
MRIELRYFAAIREALGTSQETVELPEDVRSIGALRAWLRLRGEAWAAALAEGRAVRIAFNHVMTDSADTAIALAEGCEVAFFPPVTGG